MKEILGVKMYSQKETGALLGVTSESVRSYRKKGRLSGTIIGRTYHYSEESIIAFLNGQAPKE